MGLVWNVTFRVRRLVLLERERKKSMNVKRVQHTVYIYGNGRTTGHVHVCEGTFRRHLRTLRHAGRVHCIHFRAR